LDPLVSGTDPRIRNTIRTKMSQSATLLFRLNIGCSDSSIHFFTRWVDVGGGGGGGEGLNTNTGRCNNLPMCQTSKQCLIGANFLLRNSTLMSRRSFLIELLRSVVRTRIPIFFLSILPSRCLAAKVSIFAEYSTCRTQIIRTERDISPGAEVQPTTCGKLYIHMLPHVSLTCV